MLLDKTKKYTRRNNVIYDSNNYLVLICTSFINRNVLELEYKCFDCFPNKIITK